MDNIQLLIFAEVNNKLHIDRREEDVNMNCLLLNNTSCSPKQTSTIVLLYKKKYFS